MTAPNPFTDLWSPTEEDELYPTDGPISTWRSSVEARAKNVIEPSPKNFNRAVGSEREYMKADLKAREDLANSHSLGAITKNQPPIVPEAYLVEQRAKEAARAKEERKWKLQSIDENLPFQSIPGPSADQEYLAEAQQPKETTSTGFNYMQNDINGHDQPRRVHTVAPPHIQYATYSVTDYAPVVSAEQLQILAMAQAEYLRPENVRYYIPTPEAPISPYYDPSIDQQQMPLMSQPPQYLPWNEYYYQMYYNYNYPAMEAPSMQTTYYEPASGAQMPPYSAWNDYSYPR